MDWFPGLVAVLAIGAAVALVVKGWDVRLVLLSAALVISAAAGDVPVVLREFLATFSNEKFVVPICTAMGFAYVLKHTGCERHLVLLLVRPLRSVRGLLVPGVVAVGFLVNIPLVSQTSTAVCLGAVVVPLMRAAGYSLATIGACLLLGASVGGELLNPGAPELLTVAALTKVPTTVQASQYLPPLVFTQLAVATAVLWAMSVWWERTSTEPLAASPETRGDELAKPQAASPERINLLKALVPLVPLALLFATGLPEEYKLFDVPDKWVAPLKADGARDLEKYSSRLIGLAMLVGVLVAALVTPDKARDCVKEFFAGAGYGFTNVVSLIVTATCFGASIKAAGVAQTLGELIQRAPALMQPLAAFVPLAFAAISGSGMASTQSLYLFFHGPAVELGLDPVAVGAMVSLGSAAGRTMSPVAAVVLMCGTLTGTNPFTLAKRVAVPLLAGITVVVLLRLAGYIEAGLTPTPRACDTMRPTLPAPRRPRMRICLYEDRHAAGLYPLTLTRPASDLLCGLTTLGEKQVRHFAPEVVGHLCRPVLAEWLRAREPGRPVNDPTWLRGAPTVLVNGRWLPPHTASASPRNLLAGGPFIGVAGGEVAFAVLDPRRLQALAPATVDDCLADWAQTLPRREVGGTVVGRAWELIDRNGAELAHDFDATGDPNAAGYHPTGFALVGHADRLFIHPSARVDPLVVADTTGGPVVVGAGAVVTAFTRLEGPCSVGAHTHLMSAKVRGGTTIGPHCRIGGEVECSVVLGYANKYHDGFLGHSYVGEWVNLAAGTSTGDLRFDYRPVSVPLNGTEVSTGRTKVGSLIGDHAKTGLGVLLDCGTALGAFAHVLPTGGYAPRAVPSFHRAGPGGVKEVNAGRQMATADAVMRRRGRELTPAQEAVYRAITRAGGSTASADVPPVTLPMRRTA